MKAIRLIVIAAVLGALGYGGWHYFFPNAERAIRKQLEGLSAAVNKETGGNISKLANANSIAGYFTRDVAINIEGRFAQNIQGRDELLQVAMAARANVRKIALTFADWHIMVEPGGESARVHLTALVKIDNDSDLFVQEIKLRMRLENRDWLIAFIEPAKQLQPER